MRRQRSLFISATGWCTTTAHFTRPQYSLASAPACSLFGICNFTSIIRLIATTTTTTNNNSNTKFTVKVGLWCYDTSENTGAQWRWLFVCDAAAVCEVTRTLTCDNGELDRCIDVLCCRQMSFNHAICSHGVLHCRCIKPLSRRCQNLSNERDPRWSTCSKRLHRHPSHTDAGRSTCGTWPINHVCCAAR